MRGWHRSSGLRATGLALSLALASPPALANPIADENDLPGTLEWQPTAPAAPGELEAYADATSVQRGDAVAIHARADGAHELTWAVYRMGYYGGAGGRAVLRGGPVSVRRQPDPVPDPATGLLECAWPATFTIATAPGWTSGVYLVKLTRDDGLESYAIFVVRADERKGVAVVQASVTTWQAYNDWGGESLYTTSSGLAGGHAKAVSFDRPYSEGLGTGQYFYDEHYLVLWLESAGHDVTYVTNVDVGRDPSLLAGQQLFISSGHDEYWTRDERSAVEAALASGVNAAFFSANTAYLQIRLEPSSDGRPRRTEVCYKDLAPTQDPLAGTPLETGLWRSRALDEPENALLGVMAEAWQLADVPWIVSGAGSWVYEGTGLSDGDVLPLVVGYEADRVVDNGRTPPGLVVLARSPLVAHDGSPGWHNASLYTAPSGAFVFAGGVVHWPLALAMPDRADARVQRMTRNVLAAAGSEAVRPAADFGATAGRRPVEATGAALSTEKLAGAPGEEGLVDGPLANARFRRPNGVAVDRDGSLFVADTGNHVVRRITLGGAGAVTTVAGTGARGRGEGPGAGAALDHPQGLAVAGDGTLFVADTGNHRIVRIARDGSWTVTTWAGSDRGAGGFADGAGTAARFLHPMGLAALGQELYVADTHNHALRRIGPDRTVSTIVRGRGRADGPGAAARLYRPTGVAAADGALFVVDTGNRLVRRVEAAGDHATTTVAGSSEGSADGPARQARLMPFGGVAARAGEVFVSDVGSARVRRVAGGRVTTFAGEGAGTFGLPIGLALLPDGTLAVADQGDSVVRRVVRAGEVEQPQESDPGPPPAPPVTPPPAPPAEAPAPTPPAGGSAPPSGGCGSSGAAAGLLAWGALAAAALLRGRRPPRARPPPRRG